MLLRYHKRPGALYQVNKSISERDRDGPVRGEEAEEGEKDSLVQHQGNGGTYGASGDQKKPLEAAN